MIHKRIVFPPTDERLYPLFIESIGHHEDQEKIEREHGYPYYHWLQTHSGEGELRTGGKTYRLTCGSGILLPPFVGHAYEAVGAAWCTQYITFGGPLAETALHMLGLHEAALFRWDPGSVLQTAAADMLARAGSTGTDYTGYDVSADVYGFLMTLKKHGQVNNRASVSKQIMYLQPLLDMLEQRYSDPNLGLDEMAQMLDVTPRHMNTLFRHAFGLSPYAYLISLRLRISKELLVGHADLTVKAVAEQSGFRDASHFVASFRKHVGLTPEKFRQMH